MNLREAVEVVKHTASDVDPAREPEANAVILRAAEGLISIYDEHGLSGISPDSAADQCASLYELLCSIGLEVE